MQSAPVPETPKKILFLSNQRPNPTCIPVQPCVTTAPLQFLPRKTAIVRIALLLHLFTRACRATTSYFPPSPNLLHRPQCIFFFFFPCGKNSFCRKYSPPPSPSCSVREIWLWQLCWGERKMTCLTPLNGWEMVAKATWLSPFHGALANMFFFVIGRSLVPRQGTRKKSFPI